MGRVVVAVVALLTVALFANALWFDSQTRGAAWRDGGGITSPGALSLKKVARWFTKLLARGLEPPRVAPYGPEPYASANSATRANDSGAPNNAHASASRKVKPKMSTLG